MSQLEKEIQNVEASITHANKSVDLMKALERLQKNKDFKLIVGSHYFEKECIRLVLLKGTPGFDSPLAQAAIIKEMDAIGSFRMYLNSIFQLGKSAENDLASANEELEEMRGEI
jgi:hypothetical protein